MTTHIYILSCFIFDTARLGDNFARQMNPRKVQGMVSGPQRMSRAIKRARNAPSAETSDHEIKADGRCELDTRANTICAGKNFRMLSTTRGVYNVKGFHNDFDAIKDIPTARVAIAYQDEEGRFTSSL